MKRKSFVQAYLEQVEKQDAMIRNKLIEQKQWRDIALGITANMDGERVQSSGAKSKMADAVAKCVDMEAKIDILIDRLVEIKKEVTQNIEQLSNPIEYDLLHKRYIQYMPLQVIASSYGKDYSWATTTHGRALKNLKTIIEGKNIKIYDYL